MAGMFRTPEGEVHLPTTTWANLKEEGAQPPGPAPPPVRHVVCAGAVPAPHIWWLKPIPLRVALLLLSIGFFGQWGLIILSAVYWA